MSRRSRMVSGMSLRGRFLAVSVALATALGVLMGAPASQAAPEVPAAPEVQQAPQALAISGSEFNPEFIISDDLFYDGSAMTAAQIQAFLDSKIGSCQNGNCLNVAVVPVTSRPAYYASSTGKLECSELAGGNLRVSELIYRTQVACGISARVILVTLQKEQGLVTKTAPTDGALRAAMGMGCPDTAPCSDAFAGLANQIMSGTRQLKVYKAAAFARQPGLNFIGYHPNTDCGGTNLYLRNYATAALYNYTPYQPNSAALANLGGTGDSCSSYGNRNFWWYYNLWFGPTTEPACTRNPNREINQYWDDQGGATGALGALVSPGIAIGPGGTTIGSYQNGAIYCTPNLGPVGVLGDLRVKYDALGGPTSSLGGPLAASMPFSAGGISGTLQEFQVGTMLSSSTTGTFAVLQGAVRTAWGARGGSGGSLGWPTGDQESVSGGIRQQFQKGVLAIPTGKAAIVLTGAIATYWMTGTNGAVLGSPTGAATPYTAGGVTGTLQYFDRGMVLSSTTTGTFAVRNGAMRDGWGVTGGSGGSLGWPTGDQQVIAGGYRQDFQRGPVFASSTGASGSLGGAIATYWAAGSNAALLGYPISAATAWTAGGVTGTLQYFERGMVLSSTTTGTHAVLNGPMRDAWGTRGGSGGSLGWPIEDPTSGSDLQQTFQHGVLTIKTGLSGEIATYWSTGSNGTRLGSATGAPSALSAGGVTGTLQYFQRGMVLSSTTTGTFAVLDGAFRNAWGAAGGSAGTLGWPTGDQETITGGMQQQFQHGFVFVPTGGVGVVLSGAIGTYWSTGSNASRLGAATSSPSALTAGGVTGTLQYFQRGMVLSSTTTGTFAVLDGAFRNAWGGAGGSGGTLGWPTGDQASFSGGVQQQFQHGVVIVPTGGTGVVLAGDIGTYWSTGSNGTRLGSPTSSPSAFSAGGVSGTLQLFQRGMVLSSATTGTFAVLNGPIRNAWGALGGSGGTLGWPTADQESFSGSVRQQFQGGTVTITADGLPLTLTSTYYVYWSTGSNATLLGAPTASPVTWTAGGVSGSYQVFEKGMVMSSATTGTFAVLNGPIRNVWGAESGSGGWMGWPIADQVAVTGGIRQQFQHGAVMVPTTGAPYSIPD